MTLGFDLCGVAPVEKVARLDYLRQWVSRGYAGDLQYVTRSVAERVDPQRVLAGARSAIVTGTIYHTDEPLSRERVEPGVARIARYAWGEDYHDVIGRRQHLLLGWLKEHAGAAFEAVGYVDTGPVQEKALAAAAGLGWIGKHTCLINRELGSWLFLSVILTTLDLPTGTPVPDRCGTCTRCLDVCPTNAIVEPYVVDATRRLSNITIESHSGIDPGQREWVGSQVYGCDLVSGRLPLEHWRDGDRRPGLGRATAVAAGHACRVVAFQRRAAAGVDQAQPDVSNQGVADQTQPRARHCCQRRCAGPRRLARAA